MGPDEKSETAEKVPIAITLKTFEIQKREGYNKDSEPPGFLWKNFFLDAV
ncbi:hypothetical protein GCM10007103_01450 [Salinimicrobium marinum]|uniref:Uncharacterized protein n=1 Tax=Salinimicrobium marinum TaxID=680283 RepID=A0A918VTH9_9FLAO|nr:hypothetical protein GCM10007103_01450 [Salinimicrobium marinum]